MTKNKVSWLLSLLVILPFVFVTLPAYAWEDLGGGLNVPKIPITWKQSTEEYNAIPLGPSSDVSMGEAGCAQFSTAAMFIKSGARDLGWTPKDFNAEAIQRLGMGQEAGIAAGGGLHWSGAAAQSGVLEAPITGSGADFVKSHADEYLMIMGVIGSSGKLDGHWVLVDYVEGNEIYIVDSGWPTVDGKLSSVPHYGGQVGSVYAYKMKDGTKAKDLPRLNDNKDGTSTSPSAVEEPQSRANLAGGIIKEDDLVGLPTVMDMTAGSEVSPLPDPISDDIIAAASLRDQVEAAGMDNTFSRTNWVGKTVSFLGILMMFWAVFIGLAALFDKANSFLPVSMVKVTTLGQRHLKVSAEDTSHGSTNPLGMLMIVGILFGVGLFIASGGFLDVGYNLWTWFEENR